MKTKLFFSLIMLAICGIANAQNGEKVQVSENASTKMYKQKKVAKDNEIAGRVPKDNEIAGRYPRTRESLSLTYDMPVGTVGDLYGHQAMIAELNGKKVGIAINNISDRCNADYAVELCKKMGGGWRLPSVEELTALCNLQNKEPANNGLYWHFGDAALFFPAAGYEFWDEDIRRMVTEEVGETGEYWAQPNKGYRPTILLIEHRYETEMSNESRDFMISARPFCDLPEK